MGTQVEKAIKETIKVVANVKIEVDFIDGREVAKLLKIAEERKAFYRNTLKT